jgi:hypothetical protein
MKFLRLTFLLALVGGLLLISSCGGDPKPKPSEVEKKFKLLTGTSSTPITWVVTKVTYESNSDRTDEYDDPDMTLSVSGTFDDDLATTYNYSLTNRPSGGVKSPWPAGGTWRFETSSPSTLIRRTEDDLLITYSVTDTKLQMTFEYSGAGYRTSAVEGTWKFEFAPQ